MERRYIVLALKIKPSIYYFDTVSEFTGEFQIAEDDVIITNEWIYTPFKEALKGTEKIILQEQFGKGEPSDEMIDGMAAKIREYNPKRIIALGGGTIIDISKVLCLDTPERVEDIFTGKVAPKKVRELIAIPTTCGTGSEVTNVAIAELKQLKIKKGIAVEETFADMAVLIPETMESLPPYVFATSSVDALIHAVESFLSPKATPYTEMYSLAAIKIIIKGYRDIIAQGEQAKPNMKDFAIASNYAGIAFGNAGCGAVHALSYSIGGAFHVPHGEANYQFFTEVMKAYAQKNPDGKIKKLTKMFTKLLDVDGDTNAYDALENFLGKLLPKKQLKEYGMEEAQKELFTDSTIDNQQRLLANNYVELTRVDLLQIFETLY